MRFVSIDIETTGLDSDTCEVLEIGAVINTPDVDLEKLPTFRFRILRDSYMGEPYALSMHRDLFKDLATKERNTARTCCSNKHVSQDWYGYESEFQSYFAEWLIACDIDPTRFVAAGKNFANFDAPFLKKLRTPGSKIAHWHHRILDPGSMYARPSDEFVPDTLECCRRAGINPGNIPGEPHTAIHDALVAVELIRRKLGE
jgi:DNA polymerase III epsilon subunit-like protein